MTFHRGRHASKVTEEEEDEEYLKDEEDGLSGNTRLLTQPSCKDNILKNNIRSKHFEVVALYFLLTCYIFCTNICNMLLLWLFD